MGQMSVMGKRGDSVITWDPKNEESTKTAKQAFETITRQGMQPYLADGTGRGEAIREFDPEAREIIFTPPMSGG